MSCEAVGLVYSVEVAPIRIGIGAISFSGGFKGVRWRKKN